MRMGQGHLFWKHDFDIGKVLKRDEFYFIKFLQDEYNRNVSLRKTRELNEDTHVNLNTIA